MAAPVRWRPLPAFPNLPSLLISPNFGSSAYTLHVTDLANIWVETLDRKGILKRSLNEDTSIDLSDGDPEQWAVFLSKLNAAFDPTSSEYDLTSISLEAVADGTAKDGLILHISCVLPEPLKPLQWPVYLAKCRPTTLTSALVLPLIQAQHVRAKEVEDLISRLQQKDAVIKKLVDKLGTTDTRLEHVFNLPSGKRKTARATAEEKVKGLAPFDEADWRSNAEADTEAHRDVSTLVQSVFNDKYLGVSHDTGISASYEISDWWSSLGSGPTTATKQKKPEIFEPRPRTPPRTINESGDGDEDFQVQATPPHRQPVRNVQHKTTVDDDTTDGDDSTAEIPDSHPPPPKDKPRAQIGTLGGKQTTGKDTSTSQSSRTIPADDEETASESDGGPVGLPKRSAVEPDVSGQRKQTVPPVLKSPVAPVPSTENETGSGSETDDDGDHPPTKQPSSARLPIQRKAGGLGMIGGNTRAHKASSEGKRSVSPDAETTNDISSKPPGRQIDQIGSRAGETKRRRQQVSEEANELEDETQKAERKRAELAKELERKAAAPAKKKRRF